MKQEEAIDKIKKLLRLSESPNQHEAEVALKKARALMLEYHVSEGSLDMVDKKTVWTEIVLNKKWMTTFFSIIARNNRCDCYRSTSYKSINGSPIKKIRTIHIVGFSFDVECVIVMAQMVEDAVKRGITEFRRNARSEYDGSTKGVTDSYVYGFKNGLQKAFDEQNAKQEYHLMCVTPQEVKDEMNSIKGLKTVHQRVRLGYSSTERNAYARGSADGYDTGIRKQLSDA